MFPSSINRSEYLGSADAKDIVSAEPWGCRRALVYRKTGLYADFLEQQNRVAVEDDQPDFKERGRALEPIIIARVRERLGCKVEPAPLGINLDRQPWVPDFLSATPDATVEGLESPEILLPLFGIHKCQADALAVHGPGIVEAKTVMPSIFFQAVREGPRLDHALQVQHQLVSTGANWCLTVYLNADLWRWYYHVTLRDDDFGKNQYVPAAVDMWDQVKRARAGINPADSPDMWERLLPPRLEEGSKQCGSCPFRESCWGSEWDRIAQIPVDSTTASLDDDEWMEAEGQYLDAKAAASENEEALESASARLKEIMRARGLLVVRTPRMTISWKPQETLRIDTAALKREHPELAKKYLKPSTSQPFRTYLR